MITMMITLIAAITTTIVILIPHSNTTTKHDLDNHTANLPTNIVDFGGFDSSIILFYRGGILMSIWNFRESLSRAMLVGTMLVGRLGVFASYPKPAEARETPQRPAPRSRQEGPGGGPYR